MDQSTFNAVYIICSVFRTYIFYLCMGLFFNQKEANKKIEFLTYSLYFVTTTGLYLYMRIPVLMVIINILGLIVITLNYNASYKNRLLSIIYIYILLALGECIAYFMPVIFGKASFDVNEFDSIGVLITIQIVCYVIALSLRKYKHLKQGQSVHIWYWLCIFFIPLTTLYTVLNIISVQEITTAWLVCIVLLLAVNLVVFYLYDKIMEMMIYKAEQVNIIRQNNYYEKQFELIKSSINITKSLKHDINNHLIVLKLLAQEEEKEKILDYIANITDVYEEQNRYISTGNVMVDSIINFKIQQAEQEGIKLELDLKIPEELAISSFDMTTILSNLLDNAIKAAKKLDGSKKIKLKIKYDKGRLIIKIENEFIGDIIKNRGRIVTSHWDKENHGIGLQNVRETVKRYEGSMDINYVDNIFIVTILLFL